MFECPLCEERFESGDLLARHCLEAHIPDLGAGKGSWGWCWCGVNFWADEAARRAKGGHVHTLWEHWQLEGGLAKHLLEKCLGKG